MKTIEINLYSFDELSEAAKQNAIEQCRPMDNFWQSENQYSLESFANIFPVRINRNGLSFVGENAELSGWKLAKHLWNNYRKDIYKAKQYWICNGHKNCVGQNAKKRESKIFLDEFGCNLTGYYMDNQILSPVFEFMRKPNEKTTFENLMDECYNAWEKGCEEDWEFQNSDEQIIENIKANEYTFEEDGTLNNG